MKRIPFSQVLKTAAIDIRREYDRLYGMFCVQKFQDMVGAGSTISAAEIAAWSLGTKSVIPF